MSAIDDDEPPTKEELAAAKALAGHVDSLLEGNALPSVLESEERELAELSGMIHAAHSPATLDATRGASIIEAALAQGAGVGDATNELARARAKRASRLPYVGLTLAAAAAIAFLVMRPAPDSKTQRSPVARVMELPLSQQSRPGDALVGQIAREASAEARMRLDTLYGDRMAGYRALQYRRLVGEQ